MLLVRTYFFCLLHLSKYSKNVVQAWLLATRYVLLLSAVFALIVAPSVARNVRNPPPNLPLTAFFLRCSPDTQSGLQDYVDDILVSYVLMIFLMIMIIVVVCLHCKGLTVHATV